MQFDNFTSGQVSQFATYVLLLGSLFLIAAIALIAWLDHCPFDGGEAHNKGYHFIDNPWNEYITPDLYQNWFEQWCDEFVLKTEQGGQRIQNQRIVNKT